MSGEIQIETRNCDAHGSYESKKYEFMNRWSICPSCLIEERIKETQKQEEMSKAAAAERRLVRIKLAGIQPRFEGKTFSTYFPSCPEAKATKEAVEQYSGKVINGQSEGQSLIFVGKPGTGKTHLASALIHAMAEAGKHSMLITAINLVRSIRNTWNADSKKSEAEVLNQYELTDLLIIDEIGVQYGSEAEKILFFEVLNRRYENKKPSVLMSNLPLQELKVYLGDRIFDRLKEDDGKVFVFDWNSHRGQK